MSDTLYSDKILSHYYHPLNYGLRGGFDAEQRFANPLCGDMIIVRLRFDDDRVLDVCFRHEGCVISRAAASLLLEHIKGKTKDEIRGITPLYIIEEVLGISVMPARIKCATLALDAIQRIV